MPLSAKHRVCCNKITYLLMPVHSANCLSVCPSLVVRASVTRQYCVKLALGLHIYDI